MPAWGVPQRGKGIRIGSDAWTVGRQADTPDGSERGSLDEVRVYPCARLVGCWLALALAAAACAAASQVRAAQAGAVEKLCQRIGAKLDSVSSEECLRVGLVPSGGMTASGRVIPMVESHPVGGDGSARRVLLIGGTHGDEYASVSIVFKWLQLERRPGIHWRIVPLLNPDGLLRRQSRRVNARGVDLNRNLPTPNWKQESEHYWIQRTGRDPRRYPGPAAASEPETRWLMKEIDTFRPDVIVSVHAHYASFVYDGPGSAPHRLGNLRRRQLWKYPGSLGAYAGRHLGIPVLTLELPWAGILPDARATQRIWDDLQHWLSRNPT